MENDDNIGSTNRNGQWDRFQKSYMQKKDVILEIIP